VRVEGSEFDDDDVFEVSSSANTAAAEPEFQGANVCRVAALSTMLGGDRRSVRGLAAPLSDLGFPDGLSSGEQVWSDLNRVESFAGLRDHRFGGDTPGGDRISLWQRIHETVEPQAAIAFLVAVLGSPLEQESAAAAAALWRQLSGIDPRRLLRDRPWPPFLWDRLYYLLGPGWEEPAWWGFPWAQAGVLDIDTDIEDSTEVPWEPGTWIAIYQRAMSLLGDRYEDIWLIGLLVRWRLSRALRSPDLVTRSLAQAAFWPPAAVGVADIPPPSLPPATPSKALIVSTMIHGTWAWVGDWWEPGGEFHKFIRENYRSNLYNEGAPFSWSGAYRPGHRKRGAQRLFKWADSLAPGGFETVFAHSYGGDVAARAVAIHRTRVHELVLLSAPVTAYVKAAAETNMRVVDVRLYFDPVLALAHRWQRVEERPNVTEVIFKKWRLDHGATHSPQVWRKEKVAQKGRISARP
jgi:hypothetical protein